MANDESEQPGKSAEASSGQNGGKKRTHRRPEDTWNPLPGHTWDNLKDARTWRRRRGGVSHTNGYRDQRATEKEYRGR